MLLALNIASITMDLNVMEQPATTDWQHIANNEYQLRKQTVLKAKQLINKTTSYAKYLEQQNYTLKENLTTRTDKLQQAIKIIKSLQSLATRQKDELLRLDAHNKQLMFQVTQQADLLRTEMLLHEHIKQELVSSKQELDVTKQQLVASEHELHTTKQELHATLSATEKTVVDNNWQEFFVYKTLPLVC